MLIHPYRDRVKTVAGSRILEHTLGLIGVTLREQRDPSRKWSVENVYAPARRALGGIRAKVRDEKDFVSFINQRDLEVLLGLGAPGQYCKWLGEEYVEEGSPSWYGICADEEDLQDDLFDRELSLRAEMPAGMLLPSTELVRRVHLAAGIDVQEFWILLSDTDRETNISPDTSFRNLGRRWIRVEQERVRWDRL